MRFQRLADIAVSSDGRIVIGLGEVTGLIQRFVVGAPSTEDLAVDTTAVSLALGPGAALIASAGQERIHVWDTIDPRLVRAIELPDASITKVAISSDARWLAAGSREGVVWIWSLGDGDLVAKLHAHAERVSALAFSPDDTTLASAGWDGVIRLLDLSRLRTPPDALERAIERRLGKALLAHIADKGDLDL